VEHPQTGVVGHERDIPPFMWTNQNRVQVDRAALDRLPVLAQHAEDVAVQVHRVVLVRVVDDPQPHRLALAHDNRIAVWRGLAIQHVDLLEPAITESGRIRDPLVLVDVEAGTPEQWVGGGRAVGCQIECRQDAGVDIQLRSGSLPRVTHSRTGTAEPVRGRSSRTRTCPDSGMRNTRS